MPPLLEELKQQREQIKKHLEWLDGKIGELSKGEAVGSSEKNTAPTPPPSENAPASKPSEAGKAPPFVPDSDAPAYKEKTQGELRRAQFGCLALFILSTALFLFLLFGLPYLLPEKANEAEENMIEDVLLGGIPEEDSIDELPEKRAQQPSESSSD